MAYTRNKKTLFASVIIMVFIVTLVSAAFMLAIFRQDITNEYAILQSIANTESEFVSNLLHKNNINSQKELLPIIKVLNQNKTFLVFAETGDTLLSKHDGDKFKFIWSATSGGISSVQSSTLDDLYSDGFLRTLIFGESPILIGKDFLDKTVLSTYVPIVGTDLLLIAKIDLNELLIPFSKIIIKCLFFEFILLSIGTIFIALSHTKLLTRKIKETVHDLSKSQQRIKDLQGIEKSLEDMKNDMEEILEVGSFGFWSYDFKIGISNRSLRHDQIFGYDAVFMEWTFETFLKHIVDEDRAEVKEHFEDALSLSKDIDIACRITKINGDLRWIWIRGKKKENFPLLMGIVRDITARKKAEIELNDYRYHLQELVKSRTKELEAEKKRLETALASIKTLNELLPICSGCKKIRDDKGYWNQVETYIQKHTDTKFSHGLCPDCLVKLYPEVAHSFSNNTKLDKKDQ